MQARSASEDWQGIVLACASGWYGAACCCSCLLPLRRFFPPRSLPPLPPSAGADPPPDRGPGRRRLLRPAEGRIRPGQDRFRCRRGAHRGHRARRYGNCHAGQSAVVRDPQQLVRPGRARRCFAIAGGLRIAGRRQPRGQDCPPDRPSGEPGHSGGLPDNSLRTIAPGGKNGGLATAGGKGRRGRESRTWPQCSKRAWAACRRAPARWVLAWLQARQDPPGLAGFWTQLAAEEEGLLLRQPRDTSLSIVEGLLRFQIAALRKIDRGADAAGERRDG